VTTLSMMRFNCFLCLLMLLAVFCPSWVDAGTTGGKWVFVGFTKYRDALFIDMNRLSREADQQAQVWSRITPAERSKYYKQIQRDLKKVNEAPREFRYLETLNEINCTNRQIRYLKVLYFRPDGSVIHATRDDRPSWKSVHSGSLWDSLLAAVCDQKGGR
jgi:hypothetical protein